MVGDVEFKLTGAKEFERLLKELAPFLPVGSGNATMAAARLRRRRGRSRIVFAVVMLWSGVIGLALSARRPATFSVMNRKPSSIRACASAALVVVMPIGMPYSLAVCRARWICASTSGTPLWPA
jgi:hypothetical protein